MKVKIVSICLAVLVLASSLLTGGCAENQAQAADQTYYYYFGRWEWVTEEGSSFWKAPGGSAVVGLIDFRSIPQMSQAGGSPQGFGFFVLTSQNATAGTLVATGTPVSFESYQITLTNQVKTGIRNQLGTTAIISTDLLSTIWELLTQKADPTGNVRWKPLMPNHNGVLELWLGGHSLVKSDNWTDGKYPLVLDSVRGDYAQIRAQDKAQGKDQYRRVLDALRLKYKVDWREIAGNTESPLPHQTTITDNFNRADADALGTAGVWSWTEVADDIDIVSNTARGTSALDPNATARAESALSSDDHYTQANITISGATFNRAGVLTRFQADANTSYGFYARTIDSTIFKIVAGTLTDLQVYTPDVASGSLFKLTVDGSTLSGFDDGASVGTSVTDSSITGNLYTGIIVKSNHASIKAFVDNFEAGDLAADAPAFIPKIIWSKSIDADFADLLADTKRKEVLV